MAKINRKFAAHKQVSTGSTADMEKLITQLSERDDKEQDGSNVKMLRLSSLRPHEDNIYNKNDTDEAIDELAENIKENGLLHNIVVTQRPEETGYVILSGERRYRALNKIIDRAEKSGDVALKQRFAFIPCRVMNIEVSDETLRKNREQLALDSANMFTRDGISDPEIFDAVLIRYINNMMALYGISESKARNHLSSMIKQQSGRDVRRNIDKTYSIYRDLLPELYDFFSSDDNESAKNDKVKYTKLSPKNQKIVRSCLSRLAKRKLKLGSENYRKIYMDFQSQVLNISVGENTDEEKSAELTALSNKIIAKADETISKLNMAPVDKTTGKVTKCEKDIIKIKELTLKLNTARNIKFLRENPDMKEELQALSKQLEEIYRLC